MLRSEALALDGGRHQVIYRAGEGPPLVWLHGLNGVEADASFVDQLAKHHEVIAPLAPGFNDLDELLDLRDIHDLALHYDDILDALGLNSVTVVGHSFGAMIAAELAAHVPTRVSKLVLISPLGLWNDRYPVADLFAVPSTEMPRMLYVDPARAAPPSPNGATADVEALVTLVRGMTTVARFLWPIPDRGLSRRLRRIKAHTLIIHGDKDAFVPVQYADDFRTHLPDAEVRLIRGAGHMLPTEFPSEILKAIEEELKT